MTLTNAKAVSALLRNGGRDPDEPSQAPMPLIYRYCTLDNPGKEMYALFTEPQYDDMDKSPFIHRYECLMANCILTVEGDRWLQQHVADRW